MRTRAVSWVTRTLPDYGRVGRDSGTIPRGALGSAAKSLEIERDLLILQFFAGATRRFSSSNQFSTALICAKVAAASLLIIKNRRLSGETSNAISWLSPR